MCSNLDSTQRLVQNRDLGFVLSPAAVLRNPIAQQARNGSYYRPNPLSRSCPGTFQSHLWRSCRCVGRY
ncbi:MAG: hypothetical protein RMY28_019500 [Nostoc sp. ChiSLP01]